MRKGAWWGGVFALCISASSLAQDEPASAEYTFSERVKFAPGESTKVLHVPALPGERLVLAELWASASLPPGGAVTIELDAPNAPRREDPQIVALALAASDDPGPAMVTEPIQLSAEDRAQIAVFVTRSSATLDQPASLALMLRGKRVALVR